MRDSCIKVPGANQKSARQEANDAGTDAWILNDINSSSWACMVRMFSRCLKIGSARFPNNRLVEVIIVPTPIEPRFPDTSDMNAMTDIDFDKSMRKTRRATGFRRNISFSTNGLDQKTHFMNRELDKCLVTIAQ